MVGESAEIIFETFRKDSFSKNNLKDVFWGHLGLNNQILRKKYFWVRTFKKIILEIIVVILQILKKKACFMSISNNINYLAICLYKYMKRYSLNITPYYLFKNLFCPST